MDAHLQAQVRRRAQNRCEYCRFPAQFTPVPFQVDHIIAEKHAGPSIFENLAWSCFFCNSFKGPNLAGIDRRTQEVTRLFNPRRDNWGKHFRYEGAVLKGRTAIGRATIEVLRINRLDAVTVRRSLLQEGISLIGT
jgi:hypothetical protein